MTRERTYFILNTELKRVKIGKTTDVERRLKEIEQAAGAKMKLLAVFPYSGATEEKILHRQFGEFRLFREWFKFNKSIRLFLDYNPHTEADIAAGERRMTERLERLTHRYASLKWTPICEECMWPLTNDSHWCQACWQTHYDADCRANAAIEGDD